MLVHDPRPAPQVLRSSVHHEAALQAIERCHQLAACTERPGETTRTFLSEPMHDAHRLVTGWMQATGMQVRVDAVGNLRGLIGSPEAPRLVIASHLDTVPRAGAFDGILGVMLGIAVVGHLDPETIQSLAVEIIGFSEEEGVRFRKPFLGSMAAVGTLDDATLALADADGMTVAEAIRHFGLDPSGLADARLAPSAVAYLEFHIEQGPVLESLDQPLGVVDALVGCTRMELLFTGQANHAGTTPMHLRRDPMAAAAEWIVSVETLARSQEALVATVGRLDASPGAINVIPGTVSVLLDLRHADDTIRLEALASLLHQAEQAARERGVTLTSRLLSQQPAVHLDGGLITLLNRSVAEISQSPAAMTSGAGHDAMIVAPHLPSAMLFLRSPGGISHHPDESVLPDDVEAALAAGVAFVRNLGQQVASRTPEPK